MDTAWACQLLDNSRLEVLPTADADQVAAVVPSGRTVTVTCSPRLGVDKTVEAALALRQRGLRVVPHIAARGLDGLAHLQRIAWKLGEASVDEIFVIGGDADRPAGDFASAIDVLEALASLDVPPFAIGVAGYPEGHPRIPTEALMRALAAKQAYAAYVVTQMTFDPQAIVSWMDKADRTGITLPVYICLPGRVRLDRLVRIGLRLGIGDSLRYLEKQRSLLTGLLGVGALYDPWNVIHGLAGAAPRTRDRIVGIHWSTFNEVDATLSWLERRRAELTCTSGAGIAALQENERR